MSLSRPPRLALATLLATSVSALALPAMADAVNCNLSAYKPANGLTAAQNGDRLVLTWAADPGVEGRLTLTVQGGAPRISDLSLRKVGGTWSSIVANASPEFSVTTGLRRMSNQQLQPLRDMGVPITQEIVDRYRWDPFWDAPLDMSTPRPNANGNFAGNPPPVAGLPGTDQPGLPRKADEVASGDAAFDVKSCSVRTDGARLIVSYPGVKLGLFEGRLEYTLYRGTNLVRQEVVASTQKNWVAYKYDAGLKGLALTPSARLSWRDTGGSWQENQFGGSTNDERVPLKASNRIAFAQSGAGSLAAFPPPHKFFWAREVAINMGYNWYRKDGETSFAFGIRQNDHEDESENQANWALYSARPGTEQLMTLFLYPSLDAPRQSVTRALAFTNGDRYRKLPGYQVMNHHYHMDLGQRLITAKTVDEKLPDLVALKGLGINIVSQVDSFFMTGFSDSGAPVAQAAPAPAPRPNRPEQLAVTEASVAGAKRHSDKDFLVMPSQEVYGSPLGGHTDLLFSHPVYWDQRKPGQPFEEAHAKFGKVYHLGGADDLMKMVQQEGVLVTMPHPRTKGSTGFPDAVMNKPFFLDPHYEGTGMRWGMGLDGSERRLCELRCWPLLDDMSNWVVDKKIPLKFPLSISEVRWMAPGDDIYASQPVTYVKLASLPKPDDTSPVIKALMNGQSFWTTGEVLAPSFSVTGTGKNRVVSADVEWTYPLDFVEIVWGDGKTTGRKVVSTTDLPPFGKHHFEIPFDATGKKWVRFAAWDAASNGVVLNPVRLEPTP